MFTLRENNKLKNAKCSFTFFFFVRKYNKLNREFTVAANKWSALDALVGNIPKPNTVLSFTIQGSSFHLLPQFKCPFTFGEC